MPCFSNLFAPGTHFWEGQPGWDPPEVRSFSTPEPVACLENTAIDGFISQPLSNSSQKGEKTETQARYHPPLSSIPSS